MMLILRARVVGEVDASLKAVTRAGETGVNEDDVMGTFDAGLESGLGRSHVRFVLWWL
jgi:hypothetical protein